MNLFKKYIILFLLFFLIVACGGNQKEEIQRVVANLMGRELLYSSETPFILLGKDRENLFIDEPSFTILNYVDSIGCTSCQLQLVKWKAFIENLNMTCKSKVQLLFLIHPKKTDEIQFFLEKDKFNYPIIIDTNNNFLSANHLPIKTKFQTFLLGKSNQVLAIGNPIHNLKVKELYLKIIQGEKEETTVKKWNVTTEVIIDKTSLSLGHFDWQKEQKATFKLRNTGNNPLVVQDVNSSCGCTSVSYSKEPVQPGGELNLEVVYKAEHPEHFNKTITVYCNTVPSLIHLKIVGDAE